MLRRDAQHLRQRGHHILQASLGLFLADRRRRRVLLYMHPVTVQIDRHRKLRHIRVIHAVTLDALLPRPFTQGFQVLLQAVGKHLRRLAEARRFYRRLSCCRRLGGLGDKALALQVHHQQLAWQGAVKQAVLLVTADAHALAEFGVAGEDRRLPALTLLTQHLTQLLIEVHQTGSGTQALAIGRVTDHQALLAAIRVGRKGRQFALIHLDPLAHTRALDVVAHRLQQTRISLVATDPQRWSRQAALGALTRLGQHLLPQHRHMLLPTAEAPVLALQVGRHIGGHQRSLDQEGTGAAHRVGECPARLGQRRPASADQNRRGQVLLQRRCALLQAITPLVQTGAGQVERQLHLATMAMHIDAQIRAYLVDAGTTAIGATQLVHHSVLDLECAKVGVVDAGQAAGEVDGQGAIDSQVITPVDHLHAGVQVLGSAGKKTLEHQQHTVTQTRPETQSVTQLDIPLYRHAGDGLLGRLGAQSEHFVTQ